MENNLLKIVAAVARLSPETQRIYPIFDNPKPVKYGV